VYCIDHGAALFAHHRWEDPVAQARRPFPWIACHVLLPFAAPIPEADARLAPLVTPRLLEEITAAVPDAWLEGDPVFASAAQSRAAYVAYLLARLAQPRAFVEEAERARIAA
jgi:hypothetical protein